MAKVVVTGGNRGIGLELCRELVRRGDEVIATCRGGAGGLEGLGVRVEAGVDVADEASVKALAGRLEGERVDVLINNAGVLTHEDLNSLDFGRIERQMAINAYGPLRVTHALLGNLDAGSKVIIVTSRMGSIEDNTSGRYYGYRMSKAAVNMAGMSLSHDLRPRRIAVGILHPGMVATGMTGHNGIPAADSARMLIERVDALTLETSGVFWHANGERLPW